MGGEKNLDFQNWASAPASWITSSGNTLKDTVLASRVRIARNLSSFPFPHNASNNLQKNILDTVMPAIQSTSSLKNGFAIKMSGLVPLNRNFLMERQLISHEHAFPDGARGLVVSAGESLSIMINEEDHIRAASFKPGFALSEAWGVLSKLDDELNQKVSIAYDSTFGYITTWPTNTGTGLRASCLLHIPGLVLLRQMPQAIQNLEGMGVTTRGFYGEGTSALGDLIQVSNSKTLGINETSIIESIEQVVKSLSKLEQKAEESLVQEPNRTKTEDRIFRSLGTLKSARLLNYEESMQHISLIRLGSKLGLDVGLNIADITNLFFLIQPAHLWIRGGGKDVSVADESRLRADYLRTQWRTN